MITSFLVAMCLIGILLIIVSVILHFIPDDAPFAGHVKYVLWAIACILALWLIIKALTTGLTWEGLI